MQRNAALALLLAALAVPCFAAETTLFRVSELVGDTVDSAERVQFGLFPNVADFQRAVFLVAADSARFVDVVTGTGPDARSQSYRLDLNQVLRIRYLIDNRDRVRQQQETDPFAAEAVERFWAAVLAYPQSGVAEGPAPVATGKATAENRYACALHGTAVGSLAGGCLASNVGLTMTEPGYYDQCGLWVPPTYTVNYPLFWTAACGVTALGSTAGYLAGRRLDLQAQPSLRLPDERDDWRVGCAIGAAVPGALLGFYAFFFLGTTMYGKFNLFEYHIENDPDGLTAIPAALTGLCVAVEFSTLGWQIGRAIDRRNAEKALVRKRALGR
jgi:hypothetical protein